MAELNVEKTAKFEVVTPAAAPADGAAKPSKKESAAKAAPAKADGADDADATAGPPSSKRRDRMLLIERAVQADWEATNAFECEVDETRPKFFVTFPYPYMNGRLHLGHAFSLTKAEFCASFKRLQGYNVLFPFGFHCTGMPIQAAANKLKAEVAAFGNPPVFPAVAAVSHAPEVDDVDKAMAALAKKGKSKKGKVASKSAGTAYQWHALEKMGIGAEQIAKFADAGEWLSYFPPLGVQDLKLFGASVDWRRSFITTEANPYYDAFVRWQFGVLKKREKISFGKRANVYSIRDGQRVSPRPRDFGDVEEFKRVHGKPAIASVFNDQFAFWCCADHDRATGEGVGPQEYTLIKLRMLEPLPAKMAACAALQGKRIFLAPATLRPETMYGQTNCFVLPDGDYGCFEQANGDVFVITERAARGLAHQGVIDAAGTFTGYAKDWGAVTNILSLKGHEILGAPLKAPLATYDVVYTLPLMTISMTKGTGVVTSVPSDAPDDWIALHELKEKSEVREKYGLTEAMVLPFAVVPIINITVPPVPESPDADKRAGWASDEAATLWCERLAIKSQKDAALLKIAKGETYLNGFTYGILKVGPHAGKRVAEAKPIIKDELVASGDALIYFEPESVIVSRSGEECIVAHTEQWYLTYGEPTWRDAVLAHVESAFNAYHPELLSRFTYTLGWMKEWACSRLFGLGTRIPWDEGWLIESLSDSTVYMAYYTVAHLLQGSATNLDGAQGSPLGINAADMTDAVWDYIFLDGTAPVSPIAIETLDKMRREFKYWYPLDLRVSGKDLIGNHLTMCLYNHAAIWNESPELWPRSMYCNGHVLLDGEKMSKSTGNFLMLDEACALYSTDAVRFALADAGDSLEDANFERKRADSAVSMLFVEEEFASRCCEGYLLAVEGKVADEYQKQIPMRPPDAPADAYLVDRAFANEMVALANETTAAFTSMRWRDGVGSGSFQLQLARDAYRDWCTRSKVPMHAGLMARYLEISTVLIAPVCPHFAEHVWSQVLPRIGRGDNRGLKVAMTSTPGGVWPVAGVADSPLKRTYGFLKATARQLRLDGVKEAKKKPTHATIYVTTLYPEYRKACLQYMRALCAGGTLVDKKEVLSQLKADSTSPCAAFPKEAKNVMQFCSFIHDYATEIGLDALDDSLPFDQKDVLDESREYLANSIIAGVTIVVEVVDLAKFPDAPGPDKKKQLASPGKPSLYLHLGV